MTTGEQRLPNELLTPILQYSCWGRSKYEQLSVMCISTMAFASISWVLYYDIILIERNKYRKAQNLISCMKRLGPEFFAHRVRALWIDITPANPDADDQMESQYSRALLLPFIIATCRNIRHLRLVASRWHHDTLLRSVLAQPKLESLTLSADFFEPIGYMGWDTILAGHSTPTLNSITHFTIDASRYMRPTPTGSQPFIKPFTKLTHVCFYVNGKPNAWQPNFMHALLQMPCLKKVLFAHPFQTFPEFEEELEEGVGSDEFQAKLWSWYFLPRFPGGTGGRDIYAVHDELVSGTLDKWRSQVLAETLPGLGNLGIWNRKPWISV
ncbi:hypothetical protein DL96DRAFT_1613823 [Flagelloscypha sp. PMI_526]|nr:hypothetical protein DL96DRAFT_1613823 [Flagelloscypha sp. PMI_526]